MFASPGKAFLHARLSFRMCWFAFLSAVNIYVQIKNENPHTNTLIKS